MDIIGSRTETNLIKHVTTSVFMCTFINTGILILFNNANLASQNIPILSQIIDKGLYSNFDTNWLFINGDVIVMTMILNSITPAIVIFGQYMVAYFFILWDRRGMHVTQCKSIQSYLDIYGGQEFSVHFRYSNMLNIFFMTVLYGTSLPLLYPIAVVSFAILYF